MRMTLKTMMAVFGVAFATQAAATQLPLFGIAAFGAPAQAAHQVASIFVVDAGLDRGEGDGKAGRHYDAVPDAAPPEYWDPMYYLRLLEHLA